jgi:g-D-glutamyl-meso-diaminopimelate peptidase
VRHLDCKGGVYLFEQFLSTPPDYDTVCRAVAWLLGRYETLKAFPIGRSVLGREITALCIGNPRSAVLFTGGVHGLEWLTTSLMLRFGYEFIHALETGGRLSEINVRKAMRNRSLVIIPCLNPDGVEIALSDDSDTWQANANGVDLNHNFDAGWKLLREMERERGIDSPAPTRYGGPHPNSEPETRAAVTFCMTWRPRSLYTFHSQGEEIYYHYGENTPNRSRFIAHILALSSGYTAAHPKGLASHGGFKDWFIEKFHRPGFTIEIGRGENPLPLEQLNPIYNQICEMLMIAALL